MWIKTQVNNQGEKLLSHITGLVWPTFTCWMISDFALQSGHIILFISKKKISRHTKNIQGKRMLIFSCLERVKSLQAFKWHWGKKKIITPTMAFMMKIALLGFVDDSNILFHKIVFHFFIIFLKGKNCFIMFDSPSVWMCNLKWKE